MNLYVPYIFMYILILLFLPIVSMAPFGEPSAGLGGLGLLAMAYFANFCILTTALIICLVIIKFNWESRVPKYVFISGVVLSIIADVIIGKIG